MDLFFIRIGLVASPYCKRRATFHTISQDIVDQRLIYNIDFTFLAVHVARLGYLRSENGTAAADDGSRGCRGKPLWKAANSASQKKSAAGKTRRALPLSA